LAEADQLHPSPASLRQRYGEVRAHSLALVEGLSPEDCCAQSMPDASPAKWHLAHVTWFFETFILEAHEKNFAPFQPAFRMLFNSYYNGVGERHERSQRGLLTRPALDEVLAYRRNVDARMEQLLDRLRGDELARVAGLLELGLQHEQQHQELLVTDTLHLFSMNPLAPAWRGPERPLAAARPFAWLAFEGGISRIGHEGDGFCFDNELPRHRVFIEPFELGSALVSNAEWLQFMDEGGYRDSVWWLSEGWDWCCTQQVQAPFYWKRDQAGQWREFGLHGLQALDPAAPVCHLSYYEADAFARWRQARLPTEAEWEMAAASGAAGLQDMVGSRWQWTSSSYAPYPGFRIADGAIGEYNGKFMVNQYVLRGSSCATPAGHARASYRNFFPTGARWQFTGLRLARSL
jgi:ergothioneine biosynthesis protein EgtB